MAAIFRSPSNQEFDANGTPYAGAKLYFYSPGTTTPANVYSNEALTTPLSQPVIADSAGRFAVIYMSSATYRVQLKTSADVLIKDWDNYDPALPVGAGALAISKGGTGATTAAAARANLGISTSFAELTGATFTGDITRDGAAGTLRQFIIKTASALRWVFGADSTAEGGSNAGSKFFLDRYADGGTLLGRSIEINRATGAIALEARPTIASGPTFGVPDFWFREEQTSGTLGGTFTSGADQTRTLNTSKRNVVAGVSLASNQVTLPSGTWHIEWRAPGFFVGRHQAFLYNVSDAAVVERGSSEGTAVQASTSSVGSAVVTIASTKLFEVRHRCETTRASDGFGLAASFGTEVFSEIRGWKIS